MVNFNLSKQETSNVRNDDRIAKLEERYVKIQKEKAKELITDAEKKAEEIKEEASIKAEEIKARAKWQAFGLSWELL